MSTSVNLCPVCQRRPLTNGLCACPATATPLHRVGEEMRSTFGQAPPRPASSADQVERAVQQRLAPKSFTDTYLRGSESTFGLPVKLLLSLPVVVIPVAFVALKLWTSGAAITLAVLGWAGCLAYLKQVWVPRR